MAGAKGQACCIPGCGHAAVEMHHVLPVEYGGPMAGKRVPLCPNHHTEIHRLFAAVIANKMQPKDIPDAVIRMLVEKIGEQYSVFRVTGQADDARRRVVLHCSEERLNQVHFLRNHYNFNSIEKMLDSLIQAEFAKATGASKG